jgi:CRP-like cAMP-binding protein
LKLVAKNREVSNKFIKLLAGNVREKEERLLQLAYSPVRERVARAIIHLADTEGELIDEKTQIKISRDDLANIVGTAKESLVRMLSEMKSDEVLQLKGKEITILKPEELRKMVDFY